MKPPFSWGTGIAIAAGVFVTGIITLVVLSVRQDVSLVHEQYYERGQDYDARLHAIERAETLREPLAITIRPDVATVAYPRGSPPAAISGSILLYRPSSRALDRSFAVSPDTAWLQSVPIADLEPGLWKIEVSWTMNGAEYFVERPVVVPAREVQGTRME
jgi:hypothetical protein